MRLLITGGSGFIGSALVREALKNDSVTVLNIDKLTYAANKDSLQEISTVSRYSFKKIDICDELSLRAAFEEFQPTTVMHLAAESHVDRSIDSPKEFIRTNITGTFRLLEEARNYHENLCSADKANFIFHHISTDEVYGDLHGTDNFFTESTPYAPSSPYSASKASSDHLVRAWGRTFGLPTVITNCSNNYGPYQFPEKLIPNIILCAIRGRPLPIYGNGLQIRDWLHVEDHARALIMVAAERKLGETYNIGGHNEKTNYEVVLSICTLLEELMPNKPSGVNNYRDLITFVEDRPGHDTRYAIDAGKIQRELGWTPEETFETGLRKTVQWYLDNQSWWNRLVSGDHVRERMGE